MKEKEQDQSTNLSKVETEFLKMINQNPKAVMDLLGYKTVIKPLIQRDYRGNGGKLGTPGLAQKYKVTRSSVRWEIKKQNGKNNNR